MSARAQGRFASMERLRDVIKSTFWMVPAACAVASILLAWALIALDATVGSSVGTVFFFPGPPEGARSFLSSIVDAMITFTGLVFSITIVVLQLTSGQFSPRVLRIFLRDRIVRYALGIFIATFVYAMVVQRAVLGTASQGAFVPRIAVTMGFVFVLGSVGIFISYLARISNMIRVATIVTEIGIEARTTLQRRLGDDSDHMPPGTGTKVGALRTTVLALRGGVVVSVNEERLVKLAVEAGYCLALVPRVGDFVPTGGPLCTVHTRVGASSGEDGPREGLDDEIRSHVALDSERTSEQDIAFSMRELVDIAERALSPAVNDPTTACQCIDALHDILRRILGHRLPTGCWSDDTGELRLTVPQYSYADYLDLAVGEIWHYGSDAAQVPNRLESMLADLSTAAAAEYQADIHRWEAVVRLEA